MLILFSVYIICLSATACRNIQSVVLCEYNELYEYNGEYYGYDFRRCGNTKLKYTQQVQAHWTQYKALCARVNRHFTD